MLLLCSIYLVFGLVLRVLFILRNFLGGLGRGRYLYVDLGLGVY